MNTPVVAVFLAKPGVEHKVEALFQSVIEETRKEPGCITYKLHRDLDEPRRFVWIEEWESRALLDQHLEADHIRRLFAELPAYIEETQVLPLKLVA